MSFVRVFRDSNTQTVEPLRACEDHKLQDLSLVLGDDDDVDVWRAQKLTAVRGS